METSAVFALLGFACLLCISLLIVFFLLLKKTEKADCILFVTSYRHVQRIEKLRQALEIEKKKNELTEQIFQDFVFFEALKDVDAFEKKIEYCLKHYEQSFEKYPDNPEYIAGCGIYRRLSEIVQRSIHKNSATS